MRVLLLTPPMTQLNTPYPATAYLMGFLKLHAERLGLELRQADPALSLFLRLFSGPEVQRLAETLRARAGVSRRARESMPASIAHFLEHADRYVHTVDAAVRFLQGRDPSLAVRIAGRAFLPEGPRFAALSPAGEPAEETLAWAFGALGTTDRARSLASLYIDDLADVVREGLDPRFALSRYGERLAASAPTFDPLYDALNAEPTRVDTLLDTLTAELVATHEPDVVGISAPFPGNVYAAFRMARELKRLRPSVKCVLGGGYVNTELRSLTETRVFDFFDYLTLDDGERPFLCLLEHLSAPDDPTRTLLRTYVREGERVVLRSDPRHHDVPHRATGTPTYEGLELDRYVSLVEMLNPMHRLWSDARWNKVTVAHGCYWKKCAFCDVTLDYIGRYDNTSAEVTVDRMAALVAETGQSGFHLVDEAAPPAGLKAMAELLLERGLTVTWWGNIRFEKAFTPALAKLLARSGCVGVTGGLEVASDRLLALMQKGVTVEQVARVTKAFTDAGVLVHAYLMYGFPTQTEQETVDALERVRQLFAAGCLHSAFWHRFACTVHAPVGRDPARYGITLVDGPASTFARNDVDFVDPVGCDHDRLGLGLKRALYNYMLGLGLDEDVRTFFAPEGRVPKPKVPRDLVARALATRG